MQQENSLQLVADPETYGIPRMVSLGQKQPVIHLVLGKVSMYAMQQENSLQLVADPETYGIHLTELYGKKHQVIHLVRVLLDIYIMQQGNSFAIGTGDPDHILYSSNGINWKKTLGTVKSIITYTAVPTGRLTG